MIPSLPDILEADLDIVFVGINPGTYSARKGHYYANPTNLFWPMLFRSGLIPTPLKPEDDWRLIRFRMGLTDIVKRVTESASELSSAECRKGGEILRKKIAFYSPRVVCFNGLTVYRALFGRSEGPGPKAPQIGMSQVYVIPSTSRRNAHYTKEKVLYWFKQLNQFCRDRLR
ncbi:MAG: mismatch-specific DNA-glycosylase [Nitrospiria bacterium]